MTEAEWITCADPERLLDPFRWWFDERKLTWVPGPAKVSGRKLRLFSCACSRSRVPSCLDEAELQFLDMVEQQIDSALSSEEWQQAIDAFVQYHDSHPVTRFGHDRSFRVANRMMLLDQALGGTQCVFHGVNQERGEQPNQAGTTDQSAESELLRDIVHFPFQTPVIESGWRASPVMSLAQRIYDERAFDEMPILADALKAAGCRNEEILGHCRVPGLHVRGCWAIDLLLEKE